MTVRYLSQRDHYAGQGNHSRGTARAKGSAPIAVVLTLFVLCPYAQAAAKQSSGFRIKIAFVFNFLKFTEWPADKGKDHFVVGVIGKTPLAEGKAEVPNAKVGDRSVFIFVLPSWSKADRETQDKLLNDCHALFVCESARHDTKEILERLQGKAVLTVGESDRFIEQGGVFNFFVENQKVRFDANLKAATAANLKIRAKLLRLARQVTK